MSAQQRQCLKLLKADVTLHVRCPKMTKTDAVTQEPNSSIC